MRTRLTDLLGLTHPIVLPGMTYVAVPSLVAAVSNAGGLGILTALTQPSPDALRQEIERYTFRLPGQAGAYFYGYQRLLQLRTETELAMGPRFDRLAFNDFLLDQGMLPPDLLAQAVREGLVRK